MSGGFVFDANRCTGCAACSLACSTENGLGWGSSWRQVIPFNPELRPGVPSFHLSLACNHCDDAPCVTQCPTTAMRRDPATGAVLVDEATCIGCRYCAWACPYDAPRFDGDRGVMTKCTLCAHRLSVGGIPACVEACPTDALGYGPLEGEPGIPGFPRRPHGPRIAFAPLRRRTPPQSTWTLPDEALEAFAPPPSGKEGRAAPPHAGRRLRRTVLSLGAELPLWIFTSGVALLVAWVSAAVMGGPRVLPWAFLGVAMALMALSMTHLGRPLRAWRALTNLRTSRLSREIAGVGAFVAAGFVWSAMDLAVVPSRLVEATGWVAALLGVLALHLVDRVYDPVRSPGSRLHSGDALVVAAAPAAALLQAPGAYALLALATLGILALRMPPADRTDVVLAGARVGTLLAAPLPWVMAPSGSPWWPAALVAAGAMADRAALYRSLAIGGPATQAVVDASAWKR